MKIQLINQAGISDVDFKNLINATQIFTDSVVKAWKLPTYTITQDAGDWAVYLTEDKRKAGAKGYHTVSNGKVVAYVSPKASTSLYGKVWKAIFLKGKLLLPERYSEGLITVICHEVAEMICDPYITTMSAVDYKGRSWLVEVCDHCRGYYWTKQTSQQVCVFPDVTTPAYYDIAGVAPYSLTNMIVAPFTLSPTGYGYYKDSTNKLIKL